MFPCRHQLARNRDDNVGMMNHFNNQPCLTLNSKTVKPNSLTLGEL